MPRVQEGKTGFIQRFEEIEAWEKARELTCAIYECSSDGRFAKDYGLRNQSRGATISIIANIAEGFDRGGKAEFMQFLSIAKGSADEVRAQLYVALDQDYLSQEKFEELQTLVESTERLLGGFVRYLKRSDVKGPKFRRDS